MKKAVFYTLEKIHAWIEKVIYEEEDRSDALLDKIENLEDENAKLQEERDILEDTVEYYKNAKGVRF